jgi:gluconokinase
LHAALESVALRFAEIYGLMRDGIGEPAHVVASGGALLHSPTWTQMMADALGVPVAASVEHEASGRGAALLALERLGSIENITRTEARTGTIFLPRAENHAIYDRLLGEQRKLYSKLFTEN